MLKRKSILSILKRHRWSFSFRQNAVRQRKIFNANEVLYNLSNSSIKPFLNNDKIELLRPFYKARDEIVWPYSFVADEDVAKDIVHKIFTNTTKEDQTAIMEINPGLGLITSNFINSGIPNIILYNCDELEELCINQMCETYPEKIQKNRIMVMERPATAVVHSFRYATENKVPMTMFAVSHSLFFLRTFVSCFVKYHLWDTKFTLFVAIGTPAFEILTLQDNYRVLKHPPRIIFNLLFNLENLGQYPRDAFLPESSICIEDMHLIKITYNENFFKYINREDLDDFYSFTNILASSKDNYIIPALERWIPHCGPYLISKGISMSLQVYELDPKEFLQLFHIIKKYEGYRDFRLISRFIEK